MLSINSFSIRLKVGSEGFIIHNNFHSSLPAVPPLEEVPYVSFQCDISSIEEQFRTNLQSLGRISRMGPVQITEMDEKPGALLIHWEEVRHHGSTIVLSFIVVRIRS